MEKSPAFAEGRQRPSAHSGRTKPIVVRSDRPDQRGQHALSNVVSVGIDYKHPQCRCDGGCGVRPHQLQALGAGLDDPALVRSIPQLTSRSPGPVARGFSYGCGAWSTPSRGSSRPAGTCRFGLATGRRVAGRPLNPARRRTSRRTAHRPSGRASRGRRAYVQPSRGRRAPPGSPMSRRP